MKPPAKITRQTAQQVLHHHFGKKAARLQQLHGGLANYVFAAELKGESLVVRISDEPAQLQVYLKEQWAVTKVMAKNIPAPEILEVGNDVIGLPYMIARKIGGAPAMDHPERRAVLKEMGRYAALINSIPTRDFGHVFDWSRNRLSRQKTWKDFLQNEMSLSERLELFAKQKILRPALVKKFRKILKQMQKMEGKPTLTHGDLRLKNVLLNGRGRICAILDWENCTSSLGPAWEYSIALHDLAIEEKEAFLEGYGISKQDVAEIAPAIKCFNVLNYYRVVQEALRKQDKRTLELLRLRLNGDLDLYSPG